MRVPNISIYDNARYNLGGLTSDLQDANEVMATQKRINSISDDPIGLTQVLDMKISIGNLDQIETNVNMGISWLKGTENALDSVNSLILDAKTQVSRLINASMSADERRDAIQSINGIIEQIITLGNTQINGNYIFSGTDSDISPLEYHGDEDPPRVSYNGNNTLFEIKTDKQVTVPVGRDGKETFWENEVDINSTNNTIIFKEDNGHGSASQIILEAFIEHGKYNTVKLEQAVRNTLNDVSASTGYGVNYEVEYNADEKIFYIREDGSYDGFIRTEFMWESGKDAYITQISADSSINPDDINLTVINESSLTIGTPEPHGTEPFRLTWQGGNTWAIDNNPGYVIIPSIISGSNSSIGIDFDESGIADVTISLDTPVTTIGQYIEFEIVPAKGDHSIGHEIGFNKDNSIYAPSTSDTVAALESDLIITSSNNKIDFREVLKGNEGKDAGHLMAVIEPKIYTSHSQLALEVEKALEEESYQHGNRIDYSVTWDEYTRHFTIKEDGTRLFEFDLLWQTGENAPVAAGGTGESIGEILGFDTIDDIAAPIESDREVEWGTFSTLIDLTEYLTNNDIDGIERTLGRLETHFNTMTSKIVDIGIKYNRLEIRDKITAENSLTLKERRSTIEDADIIEAIMNLQSIETAYQASLSSTARIINLSLVDFL